MLDRLKDSRTVAVLAALLVGAFFVARHVVRREPPPPEDVPTYAAREASDHVGEYARVCGTVAGASYVPRIEGHPTFLNLEEPYPEPVFTVLIWNDVRTRFDAPPEDAFRGRRICATGLIETHEGRTEIVLDRADKIRVAPDAPTGDGG